MEYSYIDKNLNDIKEKIFEACQRSGRQVSEVTLLSAIKSADVGEINYLHNTLGVDHVGENRVQQLMERYDKLDRENLNIHFIGSLQSNKVKYIIDKVTLIHSLDSMSLAREIDRQGKKRGIVANALVEINSGGEISKGGLDCSEVEDFCREVSCLENIKIRGFMTMAPKCPDRRDYYKYFDKTREVSERVWYSCLGRTESPILSMGMSESFQEAIECGATVVRVGRMMFQKEF